MDGGEIIGAMAVFAVLVVPSLGITARIALKPIVDSILRIREGLDRQPRPAEDPRIAALQQEVFELRETVDRLVAASDFDAQLRAGEPAARIPAATP